MPRRAIAKIAVKPRPFEDDWDTLFSLPRCLPKNKFPFRLRRVERELYQFANHGYASVRRRGDVKDEHPRNCLRVANVFWTRNEYVARVVTDLQRTINRRRLEVGKAVPPTELLRGMATGWTNAETYLAARKHRSAIPERATYDGTGQYQYKTVSIPPLEVIYSSRLKKDTELPIAVEILLRRR